MKTWLKVLAAALMMALLMCGAMALAEGAFDDPGSSIVDNTPEPFAMECTHENTTLVSVYDSNDPCTGKVIKKRVCRDCGETIAIESIEDGPGHAWGNDKVISAGDCTTPGTVQQTCSVCSATRTVTTTGDHQWTSWFTVSPATCVSDGAQERSCKICGRVEAEVTPATGVHKFDMTAATTNVLQRADCVTDGYYEAKCTMCGEWFTGENARFATNGTQVLYIPTQHTWTEWVVVAQETCTQSGQYEHRCTVCGAIAARNVPATGVHTFDMDAATTYVYMRGSCDSDGSYEAKCTQCGGWFTCAGDEETAAEDGTIVLLIPARGHNWEEPVLTHLPTCQTDGDKVSRCLNTTQTELYEACDQEEYIFLDHAEMTYDERVGEEIQRYHNLTWVTVVPASKTTQEIGYYRCTVAGCVYKSAQMVRTNHLMDATCYSYGPVGQSVVLGLPEEMAYLRTEIYLGSQYVEYDWNFEEPQCELELPAAIFAQAGDYSIVLHDEDGCTTYFTYIAYAYTLNLPAGLTAIEEEAFAGITPYVYVTIPEGVTSIGSRAFADCDGLVMLDVNDEYITIEEDAFESSRGCIIAAEDSEAYYCAMRYGWKYIKKQ